MNQHKEEEWNVVLANDGSKSIWKRNRQMYRIERREGERGVLKPLMVSNCQKDPLTKCVWDGHWLSFEVLDVLDEGRLMISIVFSFWEL